VKVQDKKKPGLLNKRILIGAVADAFRKLDPRLQIENPVMFLVYIGAIMTTVITLGDGFRVLSDPKGIFGHVATTFGPQGVFDPKRIFDPQGVFDFQISLWLWFTVLFANFAEAVAEGRGKAQAESLRRMRTDVQARRLRGTEEERIPADALAVGDTVVCETGDIIPSDGDP
jgi:K+-transporting ATPase ATPase B chain